MTLFLCHNCSDINSPSGEACTIKTLDKISHAAISCSQKYGMSDFYIVDSEEAKANHKKVFNSPLWEVHIFEPADGDEPFTNEKSVNQKSVELNLKFIEAFNIGMEKEFGKPKTKEELDRIRAEQRFRSAKPCTLESDPIKLCGWRK